MTIEILNFHTNGEFITDHFRNLVLEDRWVFAMNGLRDSLVGIDYEKVIEILSGNAKITGDTRDDPELNYETDDAKSYKKALNWKYCGIYSTVNGKYYRPYAYISSIGYSDALWVKREYPLDWANRGEDEYGNNHFFKKRCEFYMKNRNSDIQIECPKEAKKWLKHPFYLTIFMEIVPTPPIWVKTHRTQKEAILEYLEHHTISEVGARVNESPNCLNKPIKEALDFMVHEHDFEQAEIDMGWVQPEETSTEEKTTNLVKEFLNTDFQRKTEEELEEENKKELERAMEFHRQTLHIRKEVEETANSLLYGDRGWLTIPINENRSVRVPRPPFERWCLDKTQGRDLALPWEPVSYTGMKMFGDDPYHTDWILGAGLPLHIMDRGFGNEHYDEELTNAIWEYRYQFVKEKLNFDFMPLAGTGYSFGLCYTEPRKENDILMLPSLDAQHYTAMMQMPEGSVILAERGGPGSHLVIANKKNMKIGIVDNILQICKNGTPVGIDFDKGTFEIFEDSNMIDIKKEYQKYE